MNFSQMMEALAQGRIMRRPVWDSYLAIQEGASWIHFLDIHDLENDSFWSNYEFDRDDYEAADWEFA